LQHRKLSMGLKRTDEFRQDAACAELLEFYE
jgi:hypothetical protein